MSVASLESLLNPDFITKKHLKFENNDLTGDYIDGGTITNFSSTGIKDEATEQVLHLDDEGISVDNIYVTDVDASNIDVKTMNVSNKLTVNNLKYIFTETEFDTNLYMGKSHKIVMGNDEVLSRSELGPSIVYSNLRRVGHLEKLMVNGDFTGGYGALYANALSHRVGINTTEPIASFHVVSDGVNLIIDSKKKEGYIGTLDKVKLHLGTDAIASEKASQVTITPQGNVGIGVQDPNTNLEVRGDIKFSSVMMTSFKSIPEEGYYSKGTIAWNQEPGHLKPIGWICLESGDPGVWCEFGKLRVPGASDLQT